MMASRRSKLLVHGSIGFARVLALQVQGILCLFACALHRQCLLFEFKVFCVCLHVLCIDNACILTIVSMH